MVKDDIVTLLKLLLKQYKKGCEQSTWEEDRDGMGKKSYEITNKANKAIYYFILGSPKDEYSLKSIVKEFKE